jgi:hypothetical protein
MRKLSQRHHALKEAMNRPESKFHGPIMLFEKPKLGDRNAICNRKAIPVSLPLLQEVLLQNQLRSEETELLIQPLQAPPCIVASLASMEEVDGSAERA